MKKAKRAGVAIAEVEPDEILPEYDFSRGRPNKYAARFKSGGLVITLDPEVAEVFPTAAEANEALRSLAKLIQAQERRRSKRRKSA